jgi:hypothetical protein
MGPSLPSLRRTRSGVVLTVMLAVVTLLVAYAQVPVRDEDEKESSDVAQRRDKEFRKAHSGPNGQPMGGARLKALKQFEQMQSQQAAKFSSVQTATTASTLATGAWKAIGPQPLIWLTGEPASGRIGELAVDPRNASVVYAGTGEGGVWKTTDGGITWTPLTDQQASLATGSIALDPNNPDIVYVGTGEGSIQFGQPGDEYYGAGILKSTDGGASWTQIPGPFVSTSLDSGGDHILSLAVDPANSSIILASVVGVSHGGIYRSTDAGATWAQVTTCSPARRVRFFPNTGTALATCNGLKQLSRSTDDGATWTAAGNGLPAAAGSIEIAISQSSPNVVYAAFAAESTATTGTVPAVFKSVDGGLNFTALPNSPNFCNQCSYATALAVSPTDPNVVFVGGLNPWRSLDGGNTWADVLPSSSSSGNVHEDMHSFVFDASGKTLYIGTDGGVYSTTDFVGTPDNGNFTQLPWSNLNSGLNTALFYAGMAIDPNNLDLAFGGTQDNGLLRYTAPQWQTVVCGDGGSAAAPGNGTVIATCWSSGVGNQFFRSTSNGAPGTWVQTTPSPQASVRMIPPLISDPTSTSRIYYGAQQVFVTNDGAQTWQAISPNFGPDMGAIAVAPSNANVVWAADSGGGGMHVTQNALAGAGATWSSTSGQLPATRLVTAIAVDPHNPLTAYVSISGFSGFSDNGHVFKSVDGGANWTDVSSNLPNIPANSIAADPDQANTYYLATDVGVFATTDGGSSWSPLGTGLPHVVVTWLNVHEHSRTLRASTHGRGAWDFALPGASTPPPACTASAVGVTICTPASGSTVSSPVQVTAAAQGNAPIVAMKVYLDFTEVASSTSGSITASLTTTNGTHNLNVNAWDNTGKVYSAAESFSVGSAPPPPPPPGTCSTTTVGVKVCAPANGSSVSSPVQISAAALGNGKAIVAMKAYIDGVQVASSTSGTLSASVNAAAGSHSLNVNAWDTAGTVYTFAGSFSVGGAPPPPPPTTCTASAVGVTVCTPASGATVSSPFTLSAAAKGNHPITAMKAYLSGVQVAASSAATLNASITGSAGTKSLIVQAWDTSGVVYKQTLTITIK